MLRLNCHYHGAEPWDIWAPGDLESAIRQLAWQIASDAGSELLEDGTQECRDELERQIIAAATRALQDAGDEYKAPDGTLYSLEELEEEPSVWEERRGDREGI